MFLPVLLIRDFGIWGFVVFAVPNVLGAAGMGWVVRSPEASRRLVAAHQVAVYVFSEVTVAFQVFFVGWLLSVNSDFDTVTWIALVAIVIALIGWGVYTRRTGRPELGAGAAAWIASASLLGWVVFGGRLAHQTHVPTMPAVDLAALAPVCIFGFGLCPYLDVTFNRARQNLRRGAAPLAFTLGFGALFFCMILFTLAYSSAFALTGDPVRFVDGRGLVADLLIVHIVLQICFTSFAHGNAAKMMLGLRDDGALRGVIAGLGIAVLRWFLVTTAGASYAGLSLGEIGYRLFMAFYGLVFPAYVWLCMIPTRDGHSGPSRGKVRIWLFSVSVAAPMFWMGFIERQTWWLGPGLGVVLLARLFLPRGGGRGAGSGATGGA